MAGKNVIKRMQDENFRINRHDPDSDKGKGCCDPILTQYFFGEGAPGDDINQVRGVQTIYTDILSGNTYSDTDGTETFALILAGAGGGGNTLYSADDTVGAGRIATLTDTIAFIPTAGVNRGDLVVGDASALGLPVPWAVRLAYFPGTWNDPNNTNFAVFATDFSAIVPNLDMVWGIGAKDDLGANAENSINAYGSSVTGFSQVAFNVTAQGGDGSGDASFWLKQEQHGATGGNTFILSSHVVEATNPQDVLVDLSARGDGDGDVITTVKAIRNKTLGQASAGLYTQNLTDGEIMEVIAEISAGTKYVLIGNRGSGTEYLLPGTRGTVNQVLQTDGSGNVTWQTLTTGDQNPYLDAVQENLGIDSALSVATTLSTLSDPATAPHSHTLADGTFIGQIKKIYTVDVSGNHTVTPANFADGTSITMGANGMLVVLRWNGSAWRIIENIKTIAPLNATATVNP